ncbi:MAG TPA: hypothetical protein VGQ52_18670 [Gemmatimonadaceae bacterium]|jgi:hypothetical protein|nr:hypothetical protein [Gemmatimonadaceae bacterium]
MIPSLFVYAGLAVIMLGLVCIVRPLPRLRLAPRRRGVWLLGAGVALVAAGLLAPVKEMHVATPQTRLDEFMPAYQFDEVHSIVIAAPPELVFRAIQETTAGEIRFFRLLTTIRRLGRPGPENILNAPERIPILEVATRTSFLMLANDVDREIVVGTVVIAPPGARYTDARTPESFRSFNRPGFALAAMNFRLVPNGGAGTLLTTETRVYAADRATQRRFARYWRVIFPGSALIRRSWLAAIRRRASA